MAKLAEKNVLDYRIGGDTLNDFALKYMAEIPRIYQFLNNLRTHDSSGTEQVEPEAYQFKIEDDKFYIRNKANDAWVYIMDVAENGGFHDDSFGTQRAGAIADRPSTGNSTGDVYWDTTNGRVYMWLNNAWSLILSLNASDLIGYDKLLKDSDVSTPETGAVTNEANKLVRTNANGVLPVDILGNAGKIAGIKNEINNLEDGQVLTYRAASNSWRNENKGVIGSGKELAIKDGDKLIAQYSGEEAITYDNGMTAHNTSDTAHANAFAKHNTATDAHANIFKKVQSIAAAGMYNFYYRSNKFAADTTTRTALVSPTYLLLNVGGSGYEQTAAVTLDISKDAAWDTDAQEWQASHAYSVGDVVYPTSGHTTYYYRCITAGTSSTLTPSFPTTLGSTYNDGNVVWECQLDYTQAVNRKGKDFYVYACAGDSGMKLVVSPNSTVPTKYTAENSRKLGGFHCLCADVGTISGHTLSGYVAGDILPASVWDLKFRAESENEGMVFDGRKWIDIYLASWDGSKLVSVNGGVIADGESSPKWHGEKFEEEFANVGKHLLSRSDFMHCMKGIQEGVNINGSADPNTTGGHVNTSSRRIISNYGVEDCAGVLWQWGSDLFEAMSTGHTGTNTWNDAYRWSTLSVYNADVDSQQYGSCIEFLLRVLFGGAWSDGANCGSRSANGNDFSARRGGRNAGRGCSEPRAEKP
ncbi:hypothetical protein [uncultured Mitsuokella sp.]|uniref:phage major tropism determinant n=1 Tax=uncultured Mitsuokella sp. TaxID=453120 RepID=UPI0025EE12F8|nr:hypothetical protein [uncultured Mitsuokella sp.]